MNFDRQGVATPQHLFLGAGEPLIFHCHHYNLTLQQSIEDAGRWFDAPALLTQGAEQSAFPMLQRICGAGPAEERFARAREAFRVQGFGMIEGASILPTGGSLRVRNSHYGLGYQATRPELPRHSPVCYFAAGYLAAAAAVANDRPPGSYEVHETECVALGAKACRFSCTPREQPLPMRPHVGAGRIVEPMPPRPEAALETSVNEERILAALSQLSLDGNEEGSIPAFGVYLTQHFANYYNRISYGMLDAIGDDLTLREAAAHVLVEAGHVCAFNTFGGIMKSAEWEGVVRPMIETRADWIFGIVSVINALGWGRWSVVDLIEHEKLVIRVDSSYESNFHLAEYGEAAGPRCYFCRGGVAGIMNLLYVGDITQGPELSADYYAELFSSPESFVARETACRSKGDPHCEFVATRRLFE
ncbi:MAG: 4-vinyl reductase [Myxococcales bacterium]|nr:4-vinyl reductase [Myxococcales bacterium]